MLYIFTEEPSMKVALNNILPRVGLSPGRYRIISFDGVGELLRHLPAQLRALRNKDHHFVILRDNDNGDCHRHKEVIVGIVRKNGEVGRTKVRIVCQMLEAWFIGDSDALEKSRHLDKRVPKRLRTCDPDMLNDPKRELGKLCRGYGAVTGAKAISPHIVVSGNRSASFRTFVSAVGDVGDADN